VFDDSLEAGVCDVAGTVGGEASDCVRAAGSSRRGRPWLAWQIASASP